MGIYLGLIAAEICIPFLFARTQNREAREKWTLFFSVFIIFLLMALKAPSVGRDIEGYKSIYELVKYREWGDYNISWMESGYEILMMVFSKVLHAPFQVFMAAIYGFVYCSYYLFLKRYSEDSSTSIIIYICFTFLTFDTSAVRTVLGLAICLQAIPFALKKGAGNALIFAVITLIAAQIHKSAYIFFLAYFIIRIPFNIWSAPFYIGLPALALAYKGELLKIVNLYFKHIGETGSAMGGNLLIYIFSLLLTGFIWYRCEREKPERIATAAEKGGKDAGRRTAPGENTGEASAETEEEENGEPFSSTGLAVKMIYAGIFLQLFASGTVLARMAQYMQIFIMVLIPNNIRRLDRKSQIITRLIVYMLAIAYFLKFSLAENALDIVPYIFFWNAPH